MLQSGGIKMKKRFFCTPISFGIPIVFLVGSLCWVYLLLMISDDDLLPIGISMIAIGLIMVVITLSLSVRRVELHPDRIVCKGWLPRHTYELEYLKCNVGMDYSWANGRKVWWIYLCYGPPPRYSSKSLDRISTEKYRPGFIKMHYREDFYNALLEVLPERQRRGLTSAQKFMK